MRRLKAGSLFSGIGAPELAMPQYDWRWCAEIDPFAAAVHKHHFPHVRNLGDVTKTDWSQVKRADPVDLGWTYITFRKKPATDSPRYRALGNSMAVPCMRWLGVRLDMVRKILRQQPCVTGDYQ